MIDLSSIKKYRENNRIEAKKALGGLPKSIWETYSAFANTIGGYILLGVEEYKDKSLHTVDLPEPERLINEFWDIINNKAKVSVNILSYKDVSVEVVDGKHIIVIYVPRAKRYEKPVYIDGNPMTGSYRRNGEGDYRCTIEDVQAMMRDAAVKTQDMHILDNMDLSIFDYDTVNRYRIRIKNSHPGDALEKLEDAELLYSIGAAGRSKDGKLHPTVAGLLMFGHEREIIKECPGYFLDYQERLDDNTLCKDRIVSSSGEWSGNVYDFYLGVSSNLVHDVKALQDIEGGGSVHTALSEALANCLVNADYYSRCGIIIIKEKDRITITNPGGFRINIQDAISGGSSDPRNAALKKMFNLVNIGKCTGSGIPDIYDVWEKQGWSIPEIIEEFQPERITLSLGIKRGGSIKEELKTAACKEAIIAYLTDNVSVTSTLLEEFLGINASRIREVLSEMTEEGIIVSEDINKSRVYRLKS